MKTGLRFLLAAMVLSVPLTSNAGVFVSVNIAPPPLLVYEQPPLPGPDYVWAPGYWAWDPDVEDYYWVPGTWVLAPEPGWYWTPGYWAWVDAIYVWHAGYWGPHIGYYGGINYGYGYWGHGYEGGYWQDNHFYYNRTVNNVGSNNTYVYNTTVVNNYNNRPRTSFNGGDGGVQDRPRPEEEQAARERHRDPTEMQVRHRDDARHNDNQFASRGKDVIAATPRPGAFSERDVVRTEAPRDWHPDRNANRADRANDRPNREERADDRASRQETRPRIMDDNGGRRVDRGNDRSDLNSPMEHELPQTQRHRDRSQPRDNPDRMTPDVAPRMDDRRSPDLRRDERTPHYEHMRPIPRDDQPQREERPQRMERPDRPQAMERPDRPQAMERGGGGGMERAQRVEQMQRPAPQREVQRAERPAPQGRGQRPDREDRDHGHMR